MTVTKFAAIALTLGFVALLVKSVSKDFGLAVSIAASLFLILIIISEAVGLFDKASGYLKNFKVEESLILSCGKIIGIAYIAEFSASLLNGGEEKQLADKMRLFGKLAIFSSCLPLVGRLADLLLEMV